MLSLTHDEVGVVVSPPRKRFMVGYVVEVLVSGQIETLVLERVELLEKNATK